MSLREARDEKKFDKRLVTRNLRRGIISEQELNAHLADLQDSSNLLWNARDAEGPGLADLDDEDEQE